MKWEVIPNGNFWNVKSKTDGMYLDVFAFETPTPYYFHDEDSARQTIVDYYNNQGVKAESERPRPSMNAIDIMVREGSKAEATPDGVAQHAPGAKLDAGKVKAGVLGQFARALMRIAEVGTGGADKYTRGGWQHVQNGEERYEDAKWRHLLKGYIDEYDHEWELEHLAHEAWNALAQLELALRRKGTYENLP